MKSVNDRESHLLGTTTMPQEPGRHRVSDDLKERLETDAVLSAGFAAVVALCMVMFVGLYCWSRHAPIFSHSGAGVPAIEETIPWQG
jgi:hypothetical protein